MAADFTVQMINATIAFEQIVDTTKQAGSGFLVSAPDPQGQPRTVLVTARHHISGMPRDVARIGLRSAAADGSWSLKWTPVNLRVAATPQWTEHPTADVAVMTVSVPPEIAAAAIPLSWLATSETFGEAGVGPGDEMVTLGYPCGYSSNRYGFPILRAGRIASYPVTPAAAFPTFILDFTVLPGNSGGPVFMPEDARRGSGRGPIRPFVAGVLTQTSDLLDLGFVTHAHYVRETIARMDQVGAWTRPPAVAGAQLYSPRAAVRIRPGGRSGPRRSCSSAGPWAEGHP
jgi:S1-C subfamily serine protease